MMKLDVRLAAPALALATSLALGLGPLPACAQTPAGPFGALQRGAGASSEPDFASLSAAVVDEGLRFTLLPAGLGPAGADESFAGALAADGELSDAAAASSVAAHAQGVGYGTPSAWYQAMPVPEPSGYAMFLAGLVVLGVMARRRRPGGR